MPTCERVGLGRSSAPPITRARVRRGQARPAHLPRRRRRGGPAAASDVLHVGDDATLDVLGALNAGMQAAWLNRADAPVAARACSRTLTVGPAPATELCAACSARPVAAPPRDRRQRRPHRAFERGRVGPLDVVAAGQQARRDRDRRAAAGRACRRRWRASPPPSAAAAAVPAQRARACASTCASSASRSPRLALTTKASRPARAAQLAAVEHELRRRVRRSLRSASIGSGRRGPPVGVDGGDGFVRAARRRARQPVAPRRRRCRATSRAASQAGRPAPRRRRLRRRRASRAPSRASACTRWPDAHLRRRAPAASAPPHPGTARPGPARGSSRLEPPQPRGPAEQRVAQHAQEHLAAGARRPAC